MVKMKSFFTPFMRCYQYLFQFVAARRLEKNDIDLREIQVQLAVVISTGVLMWAYALLAYVSIDSSVPGIIGFFCAAIHGLSPLLFRVSNSSYMAANFLLTAGIVHQSSFAFYSGGFSSNLLIWFGILPMIGGVINGRLGALTWMVITLAVSSCFLLLELNDYQFPNMISEQGRLWSQALQVFGWIFLSSTIVIVYSTLQKNTEQRLNEQGQKIDDLFRVLFHDLANPLGRIAIGLSIARKQLPETENNRGLEIARVASDSMMEITQNIRKMYAVSKGKAHVDLSLTTLNSAVDYIIKLYGSELEKKKIKVEYNFKKNVGLCLRVEPVSFKNQVLANIISNAIKFSPEESQITITVYPVSKDSYKVEIKDNGIGIPEDLLGQLFDINKKTSRPGTHGEAGTGFGMHIMKSFVEMYGGKVIIESKDRKVSNQSGTTIKLILKGEWN
jgi:signal transduction histidine kinase